MAITQKKDVLAYVTKDKIFCPGCYGEIKQKVKLISLFTDASLGPDTLYNCDKCGQMIERQEGK